MNNFSDIKQYITKIDNFDGITTYELTPKYDGKKSFYGKAIVKTYNNLKLLYSYDTLVCAIYDNCYGIRYFFNYDIKESLLFSKTTIRHIKEFLLQNIKILAITNNNKLSKMDVIANEGCYF